MAFEGEVKNIPIKGIVRAGADSVVEDGAMNEVIGLEYKDGSFVPYKGENKSSIAQECSEYHVHNTSFGKVYVYLEETGGTKVLRYLYNGQINDVIKSSINSIEFVGNVLIIATPTDIRHYVFNGTQYVFTASDARYFPDGALRFRVTRGIAGHDNVDTYNEGKMPPISAKSLESKFYSDTTGNGTDIKKKWNDVKSAVKDTGLGSSLLTKANGILTDFGGLGGYFFVCYAYRLKTGELVYASQPMVMGPPSIKQDGRFCKSSEDAQFSKFTLYKRTNGTANDWELRVNDNYVSWNDKCFGASFTNTQAASNSIGRIFGPFEAVNYEGLSGDTFQYMLLAPSEFNADDSWENTIKEDRKLYSILCTSQDDLTGALTTPLPLTASACAWFKGGQDAAEESKIDKIYKITSTHALSNKLQFSIGTSDSLPENVASLCIFISQQVSPYSTLESGDNITVHGPFLQGQARAAGATLWHDFGLMYTYTPVYRNANLVVEDLRNTKSMYLVKEIPVSEFKQLANNTWFDVDLRGLLGDNLLVQESLPLTAFDYNRPVGDILCNYNYRLHMANINTYLYQGYKYQYILNGLNNGRGQFYNIDNNGNEIGDSNISFAGLGKYIIRGVWTVVNIKNKDSSESTVVYTSGDPYMRCHGLNSFFVYPNTDAYKITIIIKLEGESGCRIRHFDLFPNKYLGISMSKPIDGTSLYDIYTSFPATITDAQRDAFLVPKNTVIGENKIKVTNVYNPYVFPVQNTYRVGKGDVVGFARLSTALSQDTYGRNPLLIFCTDGIYTMEVDTSGVGAYTNITMLSNEVCVNPNTICELNNAVTFASSKGLMIVTSEGVREFLPSLNGYPMHTPQPDWSMGVGLELYKEMLNHVKITLLEPSISIIDFKQFLVEEDTHMTYVPKRNKLIAYNMNYEYVYWIDIDSTIVTKLSYQFKYDIKDYPDVSFVDIANNEIEFTTELMEGSTNTLIQSRPIKLDGSLKSSYRVVVRGYFENIKRANTMYGTLLVLGSYDGKSWNPIGYKQSRLIGGFTDIGCVTDRVTYKYMMVIFAGDLSEGSHIDYISVSSDIKYNNKLK